MIMILFFKKHKNYYQSNKGKDSKNFAKIFGRWRWKWKWKKKKWIWNYANNIKNNMTELEREKERNILKILIRKEKKVNDSVTCVEELQNVWISR